jgi:riboflavin-specific deaminase-like protein
MISSKSSSKVLLTWANSVDGSLSSEVGRPTPLSCNESMVFTHKLRASHDGIVVGIGTVCADNPSLTVRLCKGESPTPIVIDPKLRIPLHSKIIESAKLRKVCLVGNSFFESDNDVLERKRVLEDLGAVVLFCTPLKDRNEEIDLQVAIHRLREEMGIRKVMVEGGQRVLRSFVHQHLVAISNERGQKKI